MVSWNDAADNHDSVASDALVIPISSARPDAGVPPSMTTCRLISRNVAISITSPVTNGELPGR